MRLVLTSDTHLPRRARDLPPPLWAAIDDADVVVHAGDWVDVSALDALEARSARVIGCYGNNDGPALRARLPEIAYADLDGLRLAVIHETGPSTGATSDVRPASRRPTCWSSATPTSPGTPPPEPGCACSIPARPPTAGGSPSPPS